MDPALQDITTNKVIITIMQIKYYYYWLIIIILWHSPIETSGINNRCSGFLPTWNAEGNSLSQMRLSRVLHIAMEPNSIGFRWVWCLTLYIISAYCCPYSISSSWLALIFSLGRCSGAGRPPTPPLCHLGALGGDKFVPHYYLTF